MSRSMRIEKTVKMIIAGTAVCITGCSSGAAKTTPSLQFTEGVHYVEYGTDTDEVNEAGIPLYLEPFIKSYQGDISVDDSDLDVFMLGSQTVTVTASTDDGEAEEVLEVIVEDTYTPVIELMQKQVYIGTDDEFDPLENIIGVYDTDEEEFEPLMWYEYDDGIILDEMPEDAGFYLVDISKVDTSKAGTYLVNITAVDLAGNVSEGSYKVIVGLDQKPDTEPVLFGGKQISGHHDPDAAMTDRLDTVREYCESMGAEWSDEGCGVYFEFEDDPYEDIDAYEEDEEDVIIDDEVWEEDDESEEWDDPEEDEEWSDDEEWDDSEDYEEMPAYSDDYEKDCLEMGGVWYPGDGCAWPDED